MIIICSEKHTDNEEIIQVWLRAILKNIILSRQSVHLQNRKAEDAHISKHPFLVDVDLQLKFLVYFNQL